MSTIRCIVAALSLLAGVCAQEIELPRLLELGPLPATGDPARVLRIDRRTPAAEAVRQIEAAHAEGLARVQLAATLPNGTPGCFTLALPVRLESPTSMDLRLHRERPGVPPTSVVPLLRRIRGGVGENLVLGIDVPGNAPFEQLLQTLGAVAEAGVARVVLRAGPADDAPAVAKALAMDLGTTPRLQVRPLAVPPPVPRVGETAFGCLERADIAWAPFASGRAGGRYGGRGGAGRMPNLIVESLASGVTWLARQQLEDGSIAGDLEATALVLLTLLADGSTLDGGERQGLVNKTASWIMGQQLPDGSFGVTGPGNVAKHALATYALAEVAGLSSSGRLMRGSAQDALHRLTGLEQEGGGFADGGPAARADCTSTALAVCALGSAGFFKFEVTLPPSEVAVWFDRVAMPDGLHRMRAETPADAAANATATAAALFSRFFAGQDPEQSPVMTAAADRLLEIADVEDPWCAYWTTYALYQLGGAHWRTWNPKVHSLLEAQIREGEHAGTWRPDGGCSRLTTTALRLLTLQSYYRYTRLVR